MKTPLTNRQILKSVDKEQLELKIILHFTMKNWIWQSGYPMKIPIVSTKKSREYVPTLHSKMEKLLWVVNTMILKCISNSKYI
jgi:hypothetical protein